MAYAFITGASSGIGRHLAIEFAAKGLDDVGEQVVCLGAVDDDALEAALDRLGLGEADDDREGAAVLDLRNGAGLGPFGVRIGVGGLTVGVR